jgi:hypothetical protein
MTPWVEIILPVRDPGQELAHTAASLVAQTDRQFGVILSDNLSVNGFDHLGAAERRLAAGGIPVRRIRPPFAMGRIEHWNWAHSQSRAAWLKPLLPGQRLMPDCIERLRQCAAERPQAQIVRCDAEIQTEWGLRTVRAPFDQHWLAPGELLKHFPANVAWIANLANVACSRVTWAAAGGYDIHFPACAPLNLNVGIALRYGLANLGETLVRSESPASLNGSAGSRVNLSLELWLMMRQFRNGCMGSKLPWPGGGVRRGVSRGLSIHQEPA